MEPEPLRQEVRDAALARFDAGEPLPAIDPDYPQNPRIDQKVLSWIAETMKKPE